jgi:hypothetical protein
VGRQPRRDLADRPCGQFDFVLSIDEIAVISALDTGAEKHADSDTAGH